MKNLFQLLHESHQVVAFALIALICNIAKTVCVPTIGFLVFFMNLGLLIALKYKLLVLKVLPKSTYNSCLYGEKAKSILNYIMQQNDLCKVTVI